MYLFYIDLAYGVVKCISSLLSRIFFFIFLFSLFCSKAITLDPTQPSFFANRAAAWLMVGAPKESIKDCLAALHLDPTHVRSHLRMAKAQVRRQ